MHEEVHIQQKGIKALQHITTMLKAESQEGYDELAQEKFKAESTTAIDVQRHEAAAAKAEPTKGETMTPRSSKKN